MRNKLGTIENAPSKVPCMDGRVVWFPQVNLLRSDQLIGLICMASLCKRLNMDSSGKMLLKFLTEPEVMTLILRLSQLQ